MPGLDVSFGEYMPPEYSQQLFENLREQMGRTREKQLGQFMEGINALGQLHTGRALKKGVEQVLAPRVQSAQDIINQIAQQGLGQQVGERMGETQYARSLETLGRKQDFQRQMAEYRAEQAMRQLQLQYELKKKLADRSKSSLGDFITAGLGGGLGALAGGLPGLAIGQGLPALIGLFKGGGGGGSSNMGGLSGIYGRGGRRYSSPAE